MPYISSYSRENVSNEAGVYPCIHKATTGMHPLIEFYMDGQRRQRSGLYTATELFGCNNDLIFQSQWTEQANFIWDLLDMRHFLASRLYQVPQVQKVYSKFEHDVFYTWVVTDERDLEAQRLIYEIEDELIERFPEFEFDFYTVYALGRDPDLLVDSTLALEKSGDA